MNSWSLYEYNAQHHDQQLVTPYMLHSVLKCSAYCVADNSINHVRELLGAKKIVPHKNALVFSSRLVKYVFAASDEDYENFRAETSKKNQ